MALDAALSGATWDVVFAMYGRLRAVVCTSSLDLGVDFSPVDQVLQIGSPKGVGRLLQRAGRSVPKAADILEKAGWKKGADGIRAKDGKKLKFVYQTSINQPRQKTQAIVKQACQKAGIDVELKSVVASVYFSSDTANPDTYTHFYCDAQMYNTTMPQADPQFFMNQYVSWQVANKDNKWQGRNVSRWQNKEYDEIYKQVEQELDAVKRAALFIKLNDLVVSEAWVGKNLVMKRFHARARGRASRVEKPFANLTIIVREVEAKA